MKIKRLFTDEKSGPYKGIEWEKRTSEISGPDGSVVFHQANVSVPSSWSQIATDILSQKYFRKAGVPLKDGKKGGESDARHVFHRLAHTWKEWGRQAGYFSSDADADAFYDETAYMLAHQMAAPNSPQWFNTGLFSVYGIEGPPQGHYYVDHETGRMKKSASAYERPQPHACFILNVEDDLVNDDGIMDLVEREARLFKYGSGTGSNFSKIRGCREKLSGGGVSSGLLSFLKIADRSAAAIKSGGTTRRAAKMVTLDADHPDIEEYVDWKSREEYKVACLAAGSKTIKKHSDAIVQAINSAQGEDAASLDKNAALRNAVTKALEAGVPSPYLYQLIRLRMQGTDAPKQPQFTTDWDGEAYNTVSGQSSNNSVRVSSDFMQAVEADDEWPLVARTEGRTWKKLQARKLWNDICRAAWQCADPGIQFHSTVNEWHTCPRNGEIRASNPCSEYMFLDDTACNLASLNLMKFYDTQKQCFKIEELLHAVDLWTLVLEISIVMAQFPSEKIAQRSYDFRTLGLGFANLGSLLMVMGIPYDSEKGRAVAAAISAVISGRAYAQSARIAEGLGPFSKYKNNAADMLRVIRNHRRAAWNKPHKEYEKLTVFPDAIDEKHCPADLLRAAREAWDTALTLGEKHGYRNAQVSAVAPTGTIGLVMDCDTTGIEPDYALVKFKKLAGGGYFKIINQSIPPALEKLGYNKTEIKDIIDYCVGTGSVKGAPGISEKSLRNKGFGDEELAVIENGLQNSVYLEPAFFPGRFSKSFLEQKIGLPESTWSLPGFSLLKHLGYSEEDIGKTEEYACGAMTMEGAPHLKKADLAVFDTASAAGRRACRSIPWKAHIEMMAAVQPFVSGAISKTINMPSSSGVEDVHNAYFLAWKRMLKAIALYRDGSKLSQPLLAIQSQNDRLAAQLAALAKSAASGTEQQKQGEVPQRATAKHIHKRIPLPSRRTGYTQKAKIGTHSLFLRTGEYSDGRLGEIFLDMHKEGAAFRSLLNSFAIAVSLGLQYGVPLEEYVDAFTFTRFEPNGIVRGHDNIKMSTSVLDFIFRDLALTYLGRTDLVQVSPEDLIATGTDRDGDEKKEDRRGDKAAKAGPMPSKKRENGTESGGNGKDEFKGSAREASYAQARIMGYEGDPCVTCGNFTMVRNGTCLKCDTCGSTSGCS